MVRSQSGAGQARLLLLSCALVSPSAWAQATARFPEPAASGVPKPEPSPSAKTVKNLAPPSAVGVRVLPAPQPTNGVSAPPPAAKAVGAAAVSARHAPTTVTLSPTGAPPTLRPLVSASVSPVQAMGFYPELLPFREGLPIPSGYRVEHESANGLLAGGLVTLLVAYGAALAVGADEGFHNGSGWTALPIIGPWAAIGARSYSCSNDLTQATTCVRNAFSEVQTIAIFSADAVVQATGAVLFLAGLGSGRDELVRTDVETSMRIRPRAIGVQGLGIAVDGRF
jgi:hypothetical protein